MRTESFTTPAPIKLVLRIPAGKIELEAVPTAETRVELEASSAEAEEAVRIELRERGNGGDLVVEAPKRFFDREEYRLGIAAPAGSSVEVTTGSADIEARGRFGDVEFSAGSGDAVLEEVEGDLDAKAASGDVIVRSVGGRATVNTASGDVIVKEIGGEGAVRSASGDVLVKQAAAGLRIQTASGDVKVGSVAAGEVSLQSASGDIEVGIAPGSRVYVDAHSASGDLDSDLELGDSAPTGEGPMVELRAATMSGDVRVVRAGV
jgi:DUF4097 and DUF4098 domain-containing protein YvlB